MQKFVLHKGKILKNTRVSQDTYFLSFLSNIKFLPTEFVLIDTFPTKFLLKPFSIAVNDNNSVGIIYRVVGEGTKFISQKIVGEEIYYLGPLGNTYKFNEIVNSLRRNDLILLVAGGSGVASLVYLYKYFTRLGKKVKMFYGETTKTKIINLATFGIKNVVYTTDDGSFGIRGSVLEAVCEYFDNFSSISSITTFVCGPKSMLSRLKEIIETKLKNVFNINCYALLEEYMCCGVGVCRSCVVKVKKENTWEYKTVCKDGPLFSLSEVIF